MEQLRCKDIQSSRSQMMKFFQVVNHLIVTTAFWLSNSIRIDLWAHVKHQTHHFSYLLVLPASTMTEWALCCLGCWGLLQVFCWMLRCCFLPGCCVVNCILFPQPGKFAILMSSSVPCFNIMHLIRFSPTLLCPGKVLPNIIHDNIHQSLIPL